MANLKSSKKDLRRIVKKRAKNLEMRTSLKTYVKKVRVAITAGKSEAVSEAVVSATKKLDKAVQNGVIHPNQAARRKSRIMKAANKATAK